MKPLNLDPIEAFMAKAKGTAQGRTRDLRMDGAEAAVLAANIGEVLARVAALESRLTARHDVAATAPTSVSMDGGTF